VRGGRTGEQARADKGVVGDVRGGGGRRRGSKGVRLEEKKSDRAGEEVEAQAPLSHNRP